MPLEYLEHVRSVVQNLPHCKKLGLELTKLETGYGEIQLESRPELIGNFARRYLHSGVVMTLLDTLCGTVATSVYAGGRTVATLDLRLDHLQQLDANLPLYGKAVCFHSNTDLAYVRGWAWQEKENNHVACCVGTFMVSGPFQLQESQA